MRKFILILFSFSFLILLNANETLVFPVGPWDPYTSETAEGYGIMSKVVTEAFNAVEYEVKFDWMPWKRAYDKLSNVTEYDGSLGWAKTDERQVDYFYSESPIMFTKNVFFHRKDENFEINSYKDLEGLTIGHSTGYAVLGLMKEAEDAGILTLDISNTEVDNFKKLIHKRIDIFQCSYLVGLQILAANFSDAERETVTYHQTLNSQSPMFFIVNKKHPDADTILKKFEEGMKIIKANGSYDKIINPSR